ncbi:MAG: HIT domain-containing protein [Clostridiales bacterium]|nr:HIT domain-containing protein [Clostridiales bacterium]
MKKDCIFCKIIEGKLPATRVFENDDMIIINDISPQARRHYLLIPKKHYENIGELSIKDGELLARCLKTFAQNIELLKLENGYRLATNKGNDGRQSVGHIHIHIFGGERLSEIMC